jgi:flagellar motor switch/type III secretory pathway protein FliN
MAEAPVEVVAEVGRIVVSASELGGLTPGVVLALGPRRSDAVTLRSGGGVWARGELVAVEGELAVRITEVLGR